jgi:cell filamentation protein
MVLENKLGITSSFELAEKEELLTKRRAKELYDAQHFDALTPGTFETLSKIHEYVFQDVYDFAGHMRMVNIAKGNFRFASVQYLSAALEAIEVMPQSTIDEIIEKYVEMNIAHPFREGNGRATRLWLDHLLKHQLGYVVDWGMVNKEDYLLAMERSPVRDTEIKALLKSALTNKVDDRLVFMKGLDASYAYEGYNIYRAEEL